MNDTAPAERDQPVDAWPLGRLLSTTARLVEHRWDTHLSAWDLNHASFAVLWLLDRGPAAQRDLASHLQVKEQTMSRVLEKLERSGYVSRRRSESDRRKVLVTVTPQGRDARQQAEAGGTAGGAADSAFERALGPAAAADLREHLVVLVQQLSAQREA